MKYRLTLKESGNRMLTLNRFAVLHDMVDITKLVGNSIDKIYIDTDLHLTENTIEDYIKLQKKVVSNDDIFICLGDLIYDEDSEKLRDSWYTLVNQLNGRYKFLVLGNNDILKRNFYKLKCGFDTVALAIKLDNILFTHCPIATGNENVFNIHGHVHKNFKVFKPDYEVIVPERRVWINCCGKNITYPKPYESTEFYKTVPITKPIKLVKILNLVKSKEFRLTESEGYYDTLDIVNSLSKDDQKYMFPSSGKWVDSDKILYRYVKKVDGKPVGFIDLYPYKLDPKATMANIGIAVKPDYQHQGISKELLDKAVEWAKKNNYDLWYAVDIDNKKSLGAAIKYGFKLVDRTDDSIYLKLKLRTKLSESYFLEDTYPKTLYHLSDNKNLDRKILKPSIPKLKFDDENSTTKRVCFSTTIDGCLQGLYPIYPDTSLDDPRYTSFNGKYFYVYEPINSDFSYVDTDTLVKKRLVPDAEVSKEVWITSPVKVKLVGKIYVYPYDSAKLFKFIWRGKQDKPAISVKLKWKWVDKLKESYLKEDLGNTPKGYKDITHIIEECNKWFEANGDKNCNICWSQHMQIKKWALELKKYRSKKGPITFERDLKKLKLNPKKDNEIKMNLDCAILHAFSNWRKNKFDMDDRNRELMYCLIELREYRKKFGKDKGFSCKI